MPISVNRHTSVEPRARALAIECGDVLAPLPFAGDLVRELGRGSDRLAFSGMKRRSVAATSS